MYSQSIFFTTCKVKFNHGYLWSGLSYINSFHHFFSNIFIIILMKLQTTTRIFPQEFTCAVAVTHLDIPQFHTCARIDTSRIL